MSKVYIGQKMAGFEPGFVAAPLSRVELVDDNGDILGEAGDDTGRTLTVVHPDGTSEMAAAILAKVQGYVYRPYDGYSAMLDPAAELGDGVTAAGLYSVLAKTDITLGGLGAADISAPTTDEIEDEYPYVSGERRQIARNYAKARSLIAKTAEEISLRVDGLDSKYTELSVTVDGVTIQDETGATHIKGSSIDTTTIQANSITADKVNLTGQITFGDLTEDTQRVISSASSNASAASQKVSAWSYAGSTYIDGGKIMAGTVMASKLLGGTVGLMAADQTVVGSLDIAYTTTGIGLGINTTWGGIQIKSGGNVFLQSAGGQSLAVGDGYFTFGGGSLLLPTACYGTSLPTTGTYGQVFFLIGG